MILALNVGSMKYARMQIRRNDMQINPMSEEFRGWKVKDLGNGITAYISEHLVMLIFAATNVNTTSIGNIISDLSVHGVPLCPINTFNKNNDQKVIGVNGNKVTLYSEDLSNYATGQCFSNIIYPI